MYLLQDLQIEHNQPINIFCDNSSIIHITNDLVFHERTKHIEMDYHIICDKVHHKIIHLMTIPSSQQLADIFTKLIYHSLFSSLVFKHGMTDLHSS